MHVVNVKIYYRHVGETPYLMQEMTKTTGDNYRPLPGTFMTPPGVEYYLEAFMAETIPAAAELKTPI